jgi:RNA polymerase sigma factor (sigma-70 family)
VPVPEDGTEAGREALVRLVRDEGPRVLAGLVRTTGSLQLAEDAVQDAVVRALDSWPRTGVPPQPRAWLTVAARNRAIDLLRRESRRGHKETVAESLVASAYAPMPTPQVVADDLLRLLFTCCHPSLSPETQIALALRTLCGLTTAEVARALLVAEATMAKRLTRARQKIAVAGIPYRTPAAAELPSRLRGVLATVYLLFNEGYNASAGDDLIRSQLTGEALRLGRLLCELLPGEADVTGLLALMLLQSSRQSARLDEYGNVVLLADQDRTKWDREAIAEGMTLLGVALRRTPTRPDPYVVQAALAACHALAETWAATNWDAVVSWYDVLLTVADTPVVRLNRAVALAERDGPGAGLAALDEVGALGGYAPLPAVRAELLYRLGRWDEAAVAYRQAIASPGNAAQRRLLEERWADSDRRARAPSRNPAHQDQTAGQACAKGPRTVG